MTIKRQPLTAEEVVWQAHRDDQRYRRSSSGRQRSDYYRKLANRHGTGPRQSQIQKKDQPMKQVILDQELIERLGRVEAQLAQIMETMAELLAEKKAEGGEYAAHSLLAAVEAGDVHWKVKGAGFMLHGLAIYPEILAMTPFANANPLEVTPLDGWTAVYTANKEGHKKVIELVPPAASRPNPNPQPPTPIPHWRQQCETALNAFDFDTAMRSLEPWFPDANGVKWAREECFGTAFDPSRAKAMTAALLVYAKKRKALNGSVSKVESHTTAMAQALKRFNRAVN